MTQIKPDYIRQSLHAGDLDDDGHDTPTLVYAECNTPPTTASESFDFDTFYDVNQVDLSGVLPATLGLSYAGTTFSCDEAGVWALNVNVGLATAPGVTGVILVPNSMYSFGPRMSVLSAQPSGVIWVETGIFVGRIGDTFELQQLLSGAAAAANWATIDIIRIARSVQ